MSQTSYKPANDKELPFSDLHCHSNFSDGELSPAALVQRAREHQVQVLALTDHDTVAGLPQARLEAEHQGIRLINGTELTCFWGKRVVHIVGLGFDAENPQLTAYMDHLTELRNERALLIAQRLVKKGVPDLHDAAINLASGGQVGRPHFARAMVDAGIVSNDAQAFSRYLGAGKAGDVKVSWPEMNQGIECIKQAGGYTALAHPTKYNLTFTKIRLLVEAFSQAGGDALEISYPGVESGHILQLEKLATKHQMMVSAGSDFHRGCFHWSELGKYPQYITDNAHVLKYLL